MRGQRAALRVAAAASIVGAGVIASANEVAASPLSSHRVGCSLQAWVDLDAEIHNQVNIQGNLLSIGRVNSLKFQNGPVVPAFCGNVALTVRAETKVCGMWGCNYHTKGQWGRSANGRGESPWTRSATQGCRDGVNRYRTTTVWEVGFVQFDWQQPTTQETHSYESNNPEFNCVGK